MFPSSREMMSSPIPPIWAGGWKRILFPGIWLVYLAQTAAGVSTYSDGAGEIVGYILIALFAAAYLTAMRMLAWLNPPKFYPFLGLMVSIMIAEAFFAHEDASVMGVFIAVLIVGLGRPWAFPVIVLMTAAVVVVPSLIPAWDTEPDFIDGIALILVSLAMWGFFGLIKSNRALAEARSEVASLAAENERTRIARDLHDLLGHSLTTITVKAGLARRLAEVDPPGAARQIAEVESLARSTLTDVRAAVAGYREVSLAGELSSARTVLEAAGLRAQLPGAVDSVDPRWRELFGWVVREGVTNAVRHSRAAVLSVDLGPSWIEVVDDGRGGQSGTGTGTGTGLRGLRERVQQQGGTLVAGNCGAEDTAGWRLRVEMPA